MNSIKKIISVIIAVLFYTSSNAQIKNAKTEIVKIYGNCGMCKTTIEKAGKQKGISKVEWNKDSKMATLTYNSKKITQDAILKRIALVGYDGDKFLAPDNVYAKLPECCQYSRVKKSAVKTDTISSNTIKPINEETTSPLKAVFDVYFLLKNALVNTDGVTASAKAKELVIAINSVKIETLKTEEHLVWMKLIKNLVFDAVHINETKEPNHQREHFTSLSTNMYQLIKVSKQTETVYYQHCPMYNDSKGGDWLSKESVIKNPYYGSQMMSCGKTVETIK